MPLIPAQRTVEKETLSLRLERSLHERLKQYAAFIQSPKDYVIAQALRRLFEKDHEFGAWLKRRGEGAPDASQDVSVPAPRTRVAPVPGNGSRARVQE